MCGLIGAFTKLSNGFHWKVGDLLEELLFMDTLRGGDSTGICLVENTGEVSVVKKAVWAPEFFHDKEAKHLFGSVAHSGKVFMGHNRKATTGKVSSENAHPFVAGGELVLMHNGSLPGHQHLGTYAVDSEAIANYLHAGWNNCTTPEEKSKYLGFMGGAWALVWYDLRTEKLSIIRNAQRPLFIAQVDSTWYFASDQNMLRCALERNTSVASIVIKDIPPYTLLEFDGETLTTEKLSFFTPAPAKLIPVMGPTPTTTSAATISWKQFKRFLKAVGKGDVKFRVRSFVEKSNLIFWEGFQERWEFKHCLVGVIPKDSPFYEAVVGKRPVYGKVNQSSMVEGVPHVMLDLCGKVDEISSSIKEDVLQKSQEFVGEALH